jgi:predicted permease
MFKNYFKITLRNIVKNKTTSFINILGLSIGMAAAIFIFEWTQNELSYDQFHNNKDNLYKVWNRTAANTSGPINCWPAMASPVGPALKQQFPEVKATARVDGPNERLLNYLNKDIVVSEMAADKSFLNMFTFPLLKGNPEHAMDDVNSVVLTATTAKKVFNTDDPINKIVKINGETFKVTGIMEDLPGNTEFKFDCIIPLMGADAFDAFAWSNHEFLTYVELQPGVQVETINQKIKNIVLQHAPDARVEIFLQPSRQWHLYSNFENGEVSGGRIETVRLLFIIACLILLIACINFMNLGTAQSENRAKEVGVRKAIGATKSLLIKQFLSESLFVTLIAGVIALLLVQLCLPAFNQLVGKQLVIDYANPVFWFTSAGFILVTGLLAGSYPAFFLSAFRPVKVLKGVFKDKSKSVSPRRMLVIIQFTVAIVLITSTLIIYQQISYVQQRENGYNKNNLVQLRMTGDIEKNYALIKNELLSSGAAVSVCQTGLPITMDNGSGVGFQWGDMNPDQKGIPFSEFATTGNFVNTMGVNLISGRDIDLTEYPSDSSAILINEQAAALVGFKDPIGQIIKSGSRDYTIVGVVKNFINGSPYQRIDPMIIFGSKYWHHNMAFRLNGQNAVAGNLKLAGEIFKKYNPNYPFTYQFADEEYNQKFADEINAVRLSGIFAGLTIFISCLGLFGLAAYMAENKSKEIGIRKVLGASVYSIVQLFTKEFAALVMVAIIIAVPVGWWVMSNWLQDFSYRINISWLIFIIAGATAIIISVLTVSFQAIKAALANPVKSLRTE